MSSDRQVDLRPPTEENAAAWRSLFDDEEVMRFVGTGERRDGAYYAGLAERQQVLARSTGRCLFSVLVDGRVVGFTGIHPWSHPWGPTGSLELGWRLGRAFWGHGYATEAARVVLERARAAGVMHLVSMVQEGNLGSFAVARRLGMDSEAVLLSPEGNRVHQLGLTLTS